MADGGHTASPADLGATEAARRIAAGTLKSEDLVRACLERIEARDGEVQAWTYLDPEHALAQARRADRAHAGGVNLGRLHGVPVGIKDIIGTADMPTENGTPLDRGRRTAADAAAVALLRAQGAVIMGKTVTTELAVYTPGKTRNPHNPGHTPGGSSSGSAAAVAAGMVPLAVGSQTNGSVIRPAAFCGTLGFKPSHGAFSRYGALVQSPPLDHLGVFGRDLDDVALIAEILMAYDERDRDMRPLSHRDLVTVAAEEPPLAPALAFARTPVWDRAEPQTQAAFEELAEVLGESCDEVELPAPFGGAIGLHKTLMLADLAKNYAGYMQRGREQISERLRGMVDEGATTSAVDYNKALEWRDVLNAGLDEVFERYDAIITPAAPGEAPAGLEATGDPCFCTLWTYCGTPAITLPLLTGENGLPMGVQLVGRRGDDARLLRTARWLSATVEAALAAPDSE